jgi:hypothetical protein
MNRLPSADGLKTRRAQAQKPVPGARALGAHSREHEFQVAEITKLGSLQQARPESGGSHGYFPYRKLIEDWYFRAMFVNLTSVGGAVV